MQPAVLISWNQLVFTCEITKLGCDHPNYRYTNTSILSVGLKVRPVEDSSDYRSLQFMTTIEPWTEFVAYPLVGPPKNPI